MYKENVLDNGHVHLVDKMGSDLTVCNAARVSFNNESEWAVDQEVEARLKKSNSSFRVHSLREYESCLFWCNIRGD